MPDLDRFSRRMAWEWRREEPDYDDHDDDRLPFDDEICPHCDRPDEYCICP